jgi:subfamily B ATP-binding cassette protein MsbA
MTNSEIFKRLIKTKVNKYFKRLVFALILSVIVALSTAATAWLLDPAIKKIFLDKDLSMLYLIPIAIVVAFSTKGISLFLARATTIKVGLDISRDLQQEMAETILKSDVHTIEDKHSAKFISNFIFDTQLMRELVSTALLNMMKDTLTLTFLICLMFYQNWRLAIFAILMIPCAAIISKSLGKRMGKAAREAQEHSGNLARFLSEILKASKVIKIYQKENFEYGRAKKFIHELIEKLKKMTIIQIRATPIMEILTGFIIAGFIYYSGYLVMEGKIGINNFFSFLAAMMLAYQPIRSLASINIVINQGFSAAKRIFEIIDTKISIREDENSKNLTIKDASISFKNINFSYPSSDQHAVKNLNLVIKGGSTAALVGHSGAGKSTIFNLLPRFYDPQIGTILIDDQNIGKVSLQSLRKNISLVSQDIILFDDTVIANIAYANLNASKEEVMEAAKLAAAEDFVNNLPNKLETVIGENGVRLSGGQKQRLSIARALLKNSPIILLDEATSSLDAESENQVQRAISNLTKNKTTIIIAHRLSTIVKADTIFVLSNGEIVASGKHKELLNTSKIYKNLYDKQLEAV